MDDVDPVPPLESSLDGDAVALRELEQGVSVGLGQGGEEFRNHVLGVRWLAVESETGLGWADDEVLTSER